MTFLLLLLFLLLFPGPFLTSSYSAPPLADLHAHTPPLPHTDRGSEIWHCDVDSHGYPRDTDFFGGLAEWRRVTVDAREAKNVCWTRYTLRTVPHLL